MFQSTEPISAQQRTTAAFCLATKLGFRDLRVALVEGSLSARIAESLDVVRPCGLAGIFDNTAPLSDALVHSVNKHSTCCC